MPGTMVLILNSIVLVTLSSSTWHTPASTFQRPRPVDSYFSMPVSPFSVHTAVPSALRSSVCSSLVPGVRYSYFPATPAAICFQRKRTVDCASSFLLCWGKKAVNLSGEIYFQIPDHSNIDHLLISMAPLPTMKIISPFYFEIAEIQQQRQHCLRATIRLQTAGCR